MDAMLAVILVVFTLGYGLGLWARWPPPKRKIDELAQRIADLCEQSKSRRP